MNAEIVVVGTELLLGQTLDTNSQWLGRRLADLGINVYFRTTVGEGAANGATSRRPEAAAPAPTLRDSEPFAGRP